MEAHGSMRDESGLPSWCKAMFVVNIIWLILTSTMFLRILSGQWQETATRTGMSMEVAVVNAVLTFVLVVVGITANVFLLKLHPKGVLLAFVTLGLVVATVLVQLYGSMGDETYFGIAVGFSVWRLIYNSVFLLAILKARTVMALASVPQ